VFGRVRLLALVGDNFPNCYGPRARPPGTGLRRQWQPQVTSGLSLAIIVHHPQGVAATTLLIMSLLVYLCIGS